MNEEHLEGRRPLNVRKRSWPNRVAKSLANSGITPNQISMTSVAFAAACGLFALGSTQADGIVSATLLILAAASIQMRLICNLLDGIVAVEGGLGTASGELFNDIPDRVADPLILISAGYCAEAFVAGDTSATWLPAASVTFGWLAGLFAVLTAYVRVLAVSIGSPANFMGPMAKQHRMAMMTAGYALAAVLMGVFSAREFCGIVITLTLVIITLGCVLTCIRRSRAAFLHLESKPQTRDDA
ncbi:MAG: CDP-alcohol phosphatidyltransferase family protein [Planctomycetota bacterium]